MTGDTVRTKIEYALYALAVLNPTAFDAAERFVGGMLAEQPELLARARRLIEEPVAIPVGEKEWCPVCHTYHVDPGRKTDAGRLTRQCPLLPADVGANHPINMQPLT